MTSRQSGPVCWSGIALLTMALCWPLAALAHAQLAAAGLLSGLLHPVFGPDHFMAMLCVGIVSAQLGGRNILLVPAVFVTGMIAGSIVGIEGIQWPFTELGIATSVLFLGVAVLTVKNTSNSVPIMLVTTLFGSLHGHAHGLEIPRAADPVFYAAGFLIATTAIHILGVLIGHFLTIRPALVRWLRYMGGCIAAIGLVIFVRTV